MYPVRSPPNFLEADFLGLLSVRTCGLVDPEIPRRAVLQKKIASGGAVIQDSSTVNLLDRIVVAILETHSQNQFPKKGAFLS
jgi:hypothetical protein